MASAGSCLEAMAGGALAFARTPPWRRRSSWRSWPVADDWLPTTLRRPPGKGFVRSGGCLARSVPSRAATPSGAQYRPVETIERRPPPMRRPRPGAIFAPMPNSPTAVPVADPMAEGAVVGLGLAWRWAAVGGVAFASAFAPVGITARRACSQSCRHDRRLHRPAAPRRRGGLPGRLRDRRHRDDVAGRLAPRLCRPDRLARALRLLHRPRRAEDGAWAADRLPVHQDVRQPVAGPVVCAHLDRRFAGHHRALEQRPGRRHRFPRRPQPGRGIRLHAGTHGATAGGVPHGDGLPVRRSLLRHVPHRAGLQRPDRQVRPRRRRLRNLLRQVDAGEHRARRRGASAGASADLPHLSPRGEAHAPRHRVRARGTGEAGPDEPQ